MTDTDHDLTIDRHDTADGGRYRATVQGAEAEMTYARAGRGRIVIDHTFVPEALRGRSVGAALVARAVGDARAEGLRIVPQCSFAAAQFDRHPDWRDVLAG